MNLLLYNNICLIVRSLHITLQNSNVMFYLYWYTVLTSNYQCILICYACKIILQSCCNQTDHLHLVLFAFKVVSLVGKEVSINTVCVLVYWPSLSSLVFPLML